MRAMILILKWVASIFLFIIGTLIIMWGVFCFFGGPDPGAGSGHEGPKYGAAFTAIGLAVIFAGWRVVISGRMKKE